MTSLVTAIAMLAIVLLGLAVMVGKVLPEDAMTRLGIFIILLCLGPALGSVLTSSLHALLKPTLILVSVAVVVTVLARALLSMD